MCLHLAVVSKTRLRGTARGEKKLSGRRHKKWASLDFIYGRGYSQAGGRRHQGRPSDTASLWNEDELTRAL